MTRKNEAVSELVGTLLLLAIAIACFSIIYLYTTTHEWIHISEPTPTIFATMGDNLVKFEHLGGETVSNYTIFKNGVKVKSGENFKIGDTITVPAQVGDSVYMVGNNQLLMQVNNITSSSNQSEPPEPPSPPEVTYQYLYVVGDSNTWTAWKTLGPYPYLSETNDTIYIYHSVNAVQDGWFYFSHIQTSKTYPVKLQIYCWTSALSNCRADVYVDYVGTGSGTLIGCVAKQHTVAQWDTINLGNHTISEINHFRCYFLYAQSGATDSIYIDCARLQVTE
jgi:hypothetical protein